VGHQRGQAERACQKDAPQGGAVIVAAVADEQADLNSRSA